MSKQLAVLIVEDSESDAQIIVRLLNKADYSIVSERADTAELMRISLREKTWDIILCDYEMPQFNGLAAISLLKETGIDIPLIIVSGTIGEETAVECMRSGAHDYIMKSDLSRLVPAIERELQEAESRRKRKSAELALRETEGRFAAAFHASPNLISITRLADGKIVDVNEGYSKLLGYSREESIGKTTMELSIWTNPADRATFVGRLDKFGEITDFETTLRRKDGTVITVLDSARTIELQGETCFLSVIHDITERKQAEETLKESENKYRLIADNMTDSIAIMDMNLRFTYISPSIIRMRGYKPEEAMAQTLEQVMTPESLFLATGIFEEEMQREASGTANPDRVRIIELEEYRKDMSKIWVDVSISFLRDAQGRPTGVLSLTRDITERKQAEEKLRVSEEKYRMVVENAKEAIIVTQDMKVVFVNRAGLDMIGYSEKILAPKPITDFIHPDDRNMVADHHIRRLKGEDVQPVYSFRILGREGTVKWVEINAAVIKWKERPATLNFLNDITERKQAEEDLLLIVKSLKKAFGTIIQVMVSTIEMRDPYTAGHQTRSVHLACAIATEMGLPQKKIDGIQMAGSIHDIGKLSIPAEILAKPTKLTNIEFTLIREHSQSGYDMLKDVESPWPLAQIVYQHHERMDGSGYPRNLKGDEILMEARILSVADVVEAMASHRPYRAALGINAALDEIEKNRETLYDKAVADACLKLFREKGYKLLA